YQISKELAIDLRSLQRELEIDRSLAPGFAAETKATDRRQASTLGSPAHAVTASPTQSRDFSGTTVKQRTKRRAWTVALAVLFGLAVVSIGFGVYRAFIRTTLRSAGRFQTINFTKLTTNGNALLSAIAPDGKYVAYVRSEAGKQSLWLRQVGSAGNLEVIPPR